MTDHGNIPLNALADQIQELVRTDASRVVGFVLVTADGDVEIRTRVNASDFAQAMREAFEEE